MTLQAFESSLSDDAFSFLSRAIEPLAGGALIGLAAALLLATVGRVAGISGILGGLIPPSSAGSSSEVGFRLAFLSGLMFVGVIVGFADAQMIANDAPRPLITLAVAGLAVGFGTRLGSGCTSGHGVCGISRFSPRSMLATITFIALGAVTVAFTRLLGDLG